MNKLRELYLFLLNKFLTFAFSELANIQNYVLSHGSYYDYFVGNRCKVEKYVVLRNENRPQYGRVLSFGGKSVTVYF